MARVKLELEYDGGAYVGWQVQPNGPTIQAAVEGALAKLHGTPVAIEVAGRTDAGVHARGQVVAFTEPNPLPLQAYARGLNSILADDVAVVRASHVADDFDPRRHAKGKRYRYTIFNAPYPSPLLRRFAWQLFPPLDVGAMRAASQALLGRHDFSAFRAADCQAANPVRELRQITLAGDGGGLITLDFEGTAFLKHMVRNLVGTLVEVGRGKQPPDWVAQVLAGRDRTAAGPTAPAHGLCLEVVFYG